jgi:hypothetical protein
MMKSNITCPLLPTGAHHDEEQYYLSGQLILLFIMCIMMGSCRKKWTANIALHHVYHHGLLEEEVDR